MKLIAVSTVVLLVLVCGAPTPSPTPEPTSVPTASSSPAPTLPLVVTRVLDGWTPVCAGVPYADCHGVAAVFVNNLARNGSWVLEQSGGIVTVTPRPVCPPFDGSQDPTFCWQASAAITDGSVCMVVARQTEAVMGFWWFGQVGGDEMAGPAIPSGLAPRSPCI